MREREMLEMHTAPLPRRPICFPFYDFVNKQSINTIFVSVSVLERPVKAAFGYHSKSR